ncbi:hypothetical protein ACKWRH_23565 [Bradyrhizobium sp. Pa8]|uniref:hypothetical protein n=1 Tax=Bradyrhizobium sp. Pa8 TaxID=3386552 RepID=UPI00403F9F2F
MGINPSSFPTPSSFIGEIDWSPLARIGQIIKEQREQDEAARLIAQLYGGQGQQLDGAQVSQPPPVERRPAQAAAPAPAAAAPPRFTSAELALPPLLTPAQRIAQGFEPFGGAARPAPSLTLAANEPSPLDTAQWPQGPVGAPLLAANQPSPLDTAQWPQGPVGAPSQLAAPDEPSPLDTARWPQGPVGAPTSATAQASYSPQGLERALAVIRQKESSGDYANVTTTRNRRGQPQSALGAYGVMDFNVGPWTKEVLGRAMTPQEFLADRDAQDAVARAKFGAYANKYGLSGAARAWLAGEGGMYKNIADPLGTTPTAYAADFERKMGRDLPPEITAGTSRPDAAPQSSLAFDQVRNRAVDSIVSDEPRAPGVGAEQLQALYRNPLTRPLAIGLLQKQLDPGTYDFKIVGDNLVRTNSRTGRTEIMMRDVKNDYEIQKVKDDDGNERLVRVRKQGPEGPIDSGGSGGGGNYGKLPPNHRWKDPNDKSQGVVPIPGSEADKIGDEIVARVGLGKSFMSTLPDLRARVARGDVGIENPANHAQAIANIGVPGETKRMLDTGAEALIRMLTGAGMSKEEAAQNAQQYRITPRDTTFTINSKISALERHLNHIGELLGRSRGGGNLLAAPAAPDRAAVETELRRRGAIR